MYAVFLWFMLFWRNIRFVAIYALSCGAKFYSVLLSVEQNWQLQGGFLTRLPLKVPSTKKLI